MHHQRICIKDVASTLRADAFPVIEVLEADSNKPRLIRSTKSALEFSSDRLSVRPTQ